MWGNKKEFQLTDNDKKWVHDCFEWLLKVYGYPDSQLQTILFNQDFFPDSLSQKQTAVDPLLNDLCRLLVINRHKIRHETEKDIRDTWGTPYQFADKPFESELEIITDRNIYRLYIANSLLSDPKRLLFNCIHQCIKIRMLESGINDANEDTLHFMYLASIFMGFGVITAQTMSSKGSYSDGMWERKWTTPSDVPEPVYIYALALFYDLIEQNEPSWKKFLPAGVQKLFDRAVQFVRKNSNPFYNKQELLAKNLFREAGDSYMLNDFVNSNELYQKAIFLTKENFLKASIYNGIGYNLLRLGEFKKSIPNFQKSIETEPSYAYPYDNIGFAFIMTGDTDTGKFYLDTAIKTKGNHSGFSFRNLALYHQKRGEFAEAEQNFIKALNSDAGPVDLLEYFYAKFLFERNEKEKGLRYLKIAVEKGEHEAFEFMKTFK